MYNVVINPEVLVLYVVPKRYSILSKKIEDISFPLRLLPVHFSCSSAFRPLLRDAGIQTAVSSGHT